LPLSCGAEATGAAHRSTKADRLRLNPIYEGKDSRMRAQLFNCVEVALELLLGQQLMHLRMTRATESNHRAHSFARKFALIPLIMVAGPGDEMMPRERFLAIAKSAFSFHHLISLTTIASSTGCPSRGRSALNNLRGAS
jgi:hypothetical protein